MYGLVPIRVAWLAIAAFMAGIVPFVVVTAPAPENLAEVLGAIGLFVLPTYVGVAYFAIKSFEFVRISSTGVELCSPLWWNQRYTWDEIIKAELRPDIFSVVPVIETTQRTVKLRAAASFTQSPRSAASRALSAIQAHIGGASDLPPTS